MILYKHMCFDRGVSADGIGIIICGEFYTTFEPRFDPPAFCPNCGNDEKVEFIEKMEVIKK